MKALVTVAFPGLPDGELVVRIFQPGDEVVGDLAAVAVREKWAKPNVASDDGDRSTAAAPPAKATAKSGKDKRAKAVASGDEDLPLDQEDEDQ